MGRNESLGNKTGPSQSATLPEGWAWISRTYLRRNGSWARLMRDVDHVGFILGDGARPLRIPKSIERILQAIRTIQIILK